MMDGGLKLHNLKNLNIALKLWWPKRIICSQSKWIIFTKFWESDDIFIYGPERMERNKEMIYNPFWQFF